MSIGVKVRGKTCSPPLPVLSEAEGDLQFIFPLPWWEGIKGRGICHPVLFILSPVEGSEVEGPVLRSEAFSIRGYYGGVSSRRTSRRKNAGK